jgi:signal transduction histidine kinase/CheY-like chemotaxis protein/HPt (histidine-containing phosphotransfer) domain-containing protein
MSALPNLTVDSTIADLPCHTIELSPSACGKDALAIFEKNPGLPGVLVGKRPNVIGMISQSAFFHKLSRPFSHEIFLARPVRLFLSTDHPPALYLDSTTSINDAARAALCRPGPIAYEPIVIRYPDNGRSVLDIHVLLLAQVELLALANSTIRKQKQTADQANHAKGIFLATMSHEIRTPMNAIIGMTDLLLDTPLTPDQCDGLRTIKSSADGLLSILNDILDFSKIEAGKLELDPTDFDIRDMFADTIKVLAPLAVRKGLELILHVRSSVPPAIHTDVSRLRQIVINLVNNAIKFTPAGEICVRVDAPPSQGAADITLHVAVEDTGDGIPMEKQQLIFEPFRQADSSTTRRFGGTGLGLTICQRLSEAMGGRLWLESPGRDNRGSIFHVTIRAKPGTTSGIAGEPEPHRDLRILVIDDSSSFRESILEMLQSWHFRAAAVPDLSSACDAVRQSAIERAPFHLALIDGHLPGSNPATILQELRFAEPQPLAAILVLQTPTSPAEAQTHRLAGFSQHILKPVRPSDLLNAILQATGAHQSVDIPREPAPSTPPTRSLRILIAEDNLVNQKLVTIFLEKLGHSSSVVSNGREAVDAVAREAFDLILMDVQMPEMDGFEATSCIRQSQTCPRIPIIALTAHAMKGDRERCLSNGMDGYVAKPIRMEELRAAIAAAAPSPSAPRPSTQTSLPAPSGASLAPMSFSEALKRVSGDEATLKELAELFCREAPLQLRDIYRAVETGDLPTVRRLAHALKGAADIFCSRDCVAAAWQLESHARDGATAQCRDDLEDFDHKVQRLLIALQTLPTVQGSIP